MQELKLIWRILIEPFNNTDYLWMLAALALVVSFLLTLWMIKTDKRLNILARQQLASQLKLKRAYDKQNRKKNNAKKETFWQKNFMPNPAKGIDIRLAPLTANLVLVFIIALRFNRVGGMLRYRVEESREVVVFFLLMLVLLSLAAIMLVFVALTRQCWGIAMDFVGLHMLILWGIGKFDCVKSGCCAGIPLSWGVYNSRHDEMMFPVQAAEAIGCLLAVAVAVWYIRKSKNYVPGRAAAVLSIGLCVVRGLAEYLRYTDENMLTANEIFPGFYQVHLMALFGIGASLIWWFIAPKLSDWQSWTEAKVYALLRKNKIS